MSFFSSPVQAKPWWWAEFSHGNTTNTSNSGFERWHAFPIMLASTATNADTVIITSYTWGSASIGPVDGINGANTAGVNAIYAARTGAAPRNVHIISDDDPSFPPGVLNAGPSTITDAPNTNVTHNKFVYVGNKGMIVTSANESAGGYDGQPNNAIWFPWAQNTALCRLYEEEMNEELAGTFHDNVDHATHVVYSPYGDTIEVYFAPDANGNLGTGDVPGLSDPGTASGFDPVHTAKKTIGAVITRLIRDAKQSVFYCWNRFTDAQFSNQSIEDHLENAAPHILVEGVTDNLASGMQARLQASHCAADWNTFSTGTEMHHKFTVIDQELVATGSANHTGASMSFTNGNDENEIVIHDFRLARRFLEEYRKVQSQITTRPPINTFETTKPAAPTGFTVAATDTAFYAAWTASATTDITRYYLFIDTAAITAMSIGDGIDNDGDGYVDEDPRGDYDGFPSGTTYATRTANDDDADGSVDEDPWMAPEVQVKGRASTSGAITTWNVGDTLLPGVNYYFGVVSVDTHGNEAAPVTFGPLKLGVVVDTKLVVQLNATIVDTNARLGDTNVVAADVYIRGDTGTAQDTLTLFAVKNLGTTDSRDLTVRLWRDEDSDARVSAADTMLAQLAYSNATKRYQATFAASDSRVRLGANGKTFLVTLDIFDTAMIGDTFQAQIDIRTCSSPRRDSGPGAAATNAGKITIIFVDTTPPQAFSLAAPPDLHETSATTLTLRWNTAVDDSSPPVVYELQVDTAGTFASNILDTTGLLETFAVVALSGSDTYSWRVIARDQEGNARTCSAVRRIVVDTLPPGPATLAAPPSPTDTTLTAITFLWNAAIDTVSGVNGYHLQIDTANTFVAPFVDSSTPLTMGVRTLPANDTYYWRVLAVDDAGNTRAVGANLLRIDTSGPGVGTLSTPAANLDTKSTTIRFAWTAAVDAITGVTGYRLQIDTSNAFLAPFIDSATPLLSGTRPLPANDTYYWRVIAIDSLGNTSAYAATRLRIDTTTPTPAILATKHGDTFTSVVTCTWIASQDSNSGVAYYVFQADTSGIFVSLKDSATHSAGVTTHLFSLPISDTYFWRVLTYDSAGNSTVSSPAFDTFVTFITDTTPPNAFTLTAPADFTETRLTTVTLRWQNALDSSNPVRYRVQVDTTGTFAAPYFDSSGLIDTFINAPFPVNDTSTWRVIATDNSGNTTIASSTRRVVVDTAGPAAGSLVAPSTSTDTRFTSIAFRWNAASDTGTGVNGYRLQIDTSAAFLAPVVDSATPLTSATRTLAPNDTYWWRIIAVDDAGNTTAVSANLFRIDTVPPQAGTLSAPANPHDTTATTIVFAWTAAVDTLSGNVTYRLQVDTSASFLAPAVDSATPLVSGSRTLRANDTYSWRVVAVDNAGNTVAYPASLLRIDTTGPTAPASTLPLDSLDTTNNRLIFRWSTSSDTGTGGVRYELQIDPDGLFAPSLVDTITFGSELIITLPANDQYFWRVLALDTLGNSTAGPVRTLRIDTAPPTQVALTTYGGDSATTPVLFAWSLAIDSVTSVAAYVVQVDTSGAFVSLVESATTVDPDTDYVSGLVRVDTYFWRVLAIDTVGNVSISATDSFVLARSDTVPPTAFDLASPLDASSTTSVSIAFRWSDAFDDTSPPVLYELQVDTSGVFAANVVDTSWLADTFVTVKLAANDTYSWRVIARDNALNTTVCNAIFRFAIDTAPPSAPALAAQNGASLSSPALLAWAASSDSISGVAYYNLQIDTASSFAAPLVDSAALPFPDTAHFTAVLRPDTYYWRLYAVDALGNAALSATDSFVIAMLDTLPPVFLGAFASPSTVSNAGPAIVAFTVYAVDSAFVESVVIRLSPVGGLDSTPLLPNTPVPSADSAWTLAVVFDSTVAGDTYDLVVTAFDAANNSSTTTLRVIVQDTSAPLTSIVDTPLKDLRAGGNELSVVSTYGDTYRQVLYEYRAVSPASGWMPCTAARSLPNPDTQAPFWGFFWDISGLVSGGQYDVRAVGTDMTGATDPNPTFVRVTIDQVDSRVDEYRDPATSEHIRRQRVAPETAAQILIADGTSLSVPVAAVADTVWLRVTELDTPPDTVTMSGGVAIPGTGSFREFDREDGARTFRQLLTLTLPYGDSDALNDKVGVTRYNEADLAIYHYDELLKVWVKEPTSVVDPVHNTVTAFVNHFTLFAVLVGAPAEANLANVVIYPNPFVPYDNIDKNGKAFNAADPTSGIIFDSLPVQVSVEIYDVAGRRVASFSKSSNDARYVWDARTDDNREIASGVYVAVIKSSTGERAVKKIMIVR